MTPPYPDSNSFLDYQRAHPERFVRGAVALEVARYLIHEFTKFRSFDSAAGEQVLAQHIERNYGRRCELAFRAGLNEADLGEELVALIEVVDEECSSGPCTYRRAATR